MKVSQTVLYHSLLNITTDNGLTGTGEVAPFSSIIIEEYIPTEAQAMADLDGLDLADVPALLDDWRQRALSMRGISFALECAWHDLESQITGLPIAVLLGGPPRGDVPEILSLSADSVADTPARIRADSGVSQVIQIKLGVDDLDTDISYVREVLVALGKDQLVLADFNGALSVDAAAATLP